MGNETLQIGPFEGGINSEADPSSIADAELVDCVNLDLDLDSSLIVRPPLQGISAIGIGGTKRLNLLGTIVLAGVEYQIGSNDSGIYQRTSGDWTLITSTTDAAAMVQYDNKAWFVPKVGAGATGGSWDGTTFTTDADIPNGGAAAVYKDRFFVAPGFDATSNESRLKFSNAGVFGTWTGSDFIDINKGDGQKLVDLTVFKGNLLLFKDKSTYNMAYDGTPFDAVIDPINPLIGPSAPKCVVPYENSIFVYQEGRVYEMLNFDYQQVNIKVPFFFDSSAPSTRAENSFLFVAGANLVVRHFNRIYVFGLRTRTWTRWESADFDLNNFGRPVALRIPANDEFIAGSSLQDSKAMVRFKEILDAATDERNILGINDTFTRSVVDGWGTANSGHPWTVESGTTDHDVSGTEGTIVRSATNSRSRVRINNLDQHNFDITFQVKSSAVATGSFQQVNLDIRRQDLDNTYRATLTFNTNQTIDLAILKRVAAVDTVLATLTTALTHAAGTYFKIRFQIINNTLKAKAWLAASAEPSTWDITLTDISILFPGSIAIGTFLNTGNTNGTVTFTFDNLVANDIVTDIACSIMTKNYNLAASHVFKRLNWWGVDILTTRPVSGRVIPIVNLAKVNWSFLKNNAYKWSTIKGNPWSFVTGGVIYTDDPDNVTGSSVTRKFVKFIKALRYRQVAFRVSFPANGSTSEGPGKLYWLTMTTSTKQVVPKKVS